MTTDDSKMNESMKRYLARREELTEKVKVDCCGICGITINIMREKSIYKKSIDTETTFLGHMLTEHRKELKKKLYKEFVKSYTDYEENPIS